jgi:integrase
VKAYLVPHIGSEKLKDVTPAMLTRLYADLLKCGGRAHADGTPRPLKPRTVLNVHRTIRTALESAVEARLLDWNPAASRATKVPRVVTVDHATWTPTQLKLFLDHIAQDRLMALYFLGAATGMRRGELVGLRWRDIDLDARTIDVRETIVAYGKEVWVKKPKSPSSRRTFPDIDSRTIAVLQAHRKAQIAEQLAAEAWAGTDRVFVDELGENLKPGAVTRGMARHVRAAGLPKLTPHGLRHTFATVALEAGVDVVYVSRLMGHSSATITQDVYQHPRQEHLAEANRTISAKLLGG